MNLTALWAAGASLVFTYLVVNKAYLVTSGKMRVHGVSTKVEWAELAYQEFTDSVSTALAWPLSIPLGMLRLLRYFRNHSVGDLVDDAAKGTDIGQIQVPPRDERSDAQSEDLYNKLQLELDAALGVAPLVMVWPLLTLAWEQMDAGLEEHPVETKLTIEQRQQFFLRVASFMLQYQASADE